MQPLPGATFTQSIARFFTGFFTFSGRASRSEFWWALLFQSLISLVPMVFTLIGATQTITNMLATQSFTVVPEGTAAIFLSIGGTASLIVRLVFLVPSIAVSWRRLHDANLPGPLWFFSLIPTVGTLILYIFMLLPSVSHGSRFDKSHRSS